MEMTVDEIVRNYDEAKRKAEQIEILADLNACKKRDIVNILLSAGRPVPKPYGPGVRDAEKPAPATDPEVPGEHVWPAHIIFAVDAAVATLSEEITARKAEIEQKEMLLAQLLDEQKSWR